MSEWDTTALLSDVKERGSLPDNDLRFTTAKILAAATHELREGCAPLLSASRAEHLVYPYSQPVTAGQNTYRMPPRAVGASLRDVGFIEQGNRVFRLRQLSADELEEIGRIENQGTPYAYWLQGYNLVLVGRPTSAGTLSTPYYARPNALVAPTDAVSIAVTGHTGDAYTLFFIGTPPSGPLSTVGIQTVDVVRGEPGFETLAIAASCNVTNPSPGQWQYELSTTETIVDGDYVCLPGQAPVPQLPVEMFGLLAARTARRLLKAVGDDRWQAIDDDVKELEARAQAWLAPRVAGDTQQAGGSVGGSGLVGGIGWAFGWY